MAETSLETGRELQQNDMETDAIEAADRWTLLRDVTVFQGKLFLDGLRDLLLSPVSIGLAVFDLLSEKDGVGHRFYDLLHFGRRSDRWINLFGDADRAPAPEQLNAGDESVDDLICRLEQAVHRQHERGGLTVTAKETIDRTLNALRTRLH